MCIRDSPAGGARRGAGRGHGDGPGAAGDQRRAWARSPGVRAGGVRWGRWLTCLRTGRGAWLPSSSTSRRRGLRAAGGAAGGRPRRGCRPRPDPDGPRLAGGGAGCGGLPRGDVPGPSGLGRRGGRGRHARPGAAPMTLDPITLSVLRSGLAGIAEEMGTVLVRSAYSSNIKERRDCSAALFDAAGRMVAQAEHIPVHLGAMPESVAAVMARDPRPGDVWILNDPYTGGTHLPDITLVSPVAVGGAIVAYAVTRAHHSDIGGMSPGSMPAGSRDLWQEGLIIPPVRLTYDVLELICANSRTPRLRRGDFRAQVSANRVAQRRISELVDHRGLDTLLAGFEEVLRYAERRTREALRRLPDGTYRACTELEGDGVTDEDIVVDVTVTVALQLGAGPVGAVRQAPQGLAGPAFGVAKHLLEPGEQRVQPTVVHQLADPPLGHPVGGHLRPEVAPAQPGGARVGADQLQHVIGEPDRRDDQPLLPQIPGTGRHGTRGHAADVGVVRPGDGIGDDRPTDGHRADQRDIGEVRAAGVRVVEDPHVARPRVAGHHRRDRLRHRTEMDGDVFGLRDHPARAVEERRRAVPALLDVRGVGAADQHRTHLLGDAREAASEDRQGDRVERHRRRSRTSVPTSSTAPAQPGRTRHVASGKATTAGPSTGEPRPIRARSRTTASTRPPSSSTSRRPQAAAAGSGSSRSGVAPGSVATRRRLTISTGSSSIRWP